MLSIVGEHDLAAVQAQQERTLASIGSHGHAVRVIGAAHFPSIERPEVVLEVLRGWLCEEHI